MAHLHCLMHLPQPHHYLQPSFPLPPPPPPHHHHRRCRHHYKKIFKMMLHNTLMGTLILSQNRDLFRHLHTTEK